MQPEEYAKMYHLEDTYWWFQGRKRIVVKLLAQLPDFARDQTRVLDLGCGTGLILEYLNKTHQATGLDFSPLALQYSARRGAKNLIRADVQHLPLAPDAFHVVTALDLAEHVERDDRLFGEIHRVLKPGGHLVLTVPAHPYLWSDHDEALHHYRRYTKKELRRKIQQAGLELTRLTYCITFTYPFIAALRILQRPFRDPNRPRAHVIQLPRPANWLLKKTVHLEAHALKIANLPFGVTLLAVAQKKPK